MSTAKSPKNQSVRDQEEHSEDMDHDEEMMEQQDRVPENLNVDDPERKKRMKNVTFEDD